MLLEGVGVDGASLGEELITTLGVGAGVDLKEEGVERYDVEGEDLKLLEELDRKDEPEDDLKDDPEDL
jgi:hypothetical protein